jgi:hypothetical protein
MSEEHGEAPPPKPDSDAAPAHAEESSPSPPGPKPAPPAARRGLTQALGWLAALLVLLIAGIATSPFWAAAVAPLLPWSPPVAAVDLAPLKARVAALERRPSREVDLGSTEAALKALAGRLDRLEQAPALDKKIADTAQAMQANLQGLDQRLGKLATQSAAQKADLARDLDKLRGDEARLGAQTALLADRLAAVERQVRAQATADRKGAALLVSLLQMREAFDGGKPFAAQYDAFHTLAEGQPELTAAAAPLAGAAQKGVDSRAELMERLRRIAGHVATATAPPAPSDWAAAALARMRALVTIRRIGGAAQTAPEAAVTDAEKALAGGDLGGATAALDRLSGPPAAAAAPWLHAAHTRLAAEAAFDRLQRMLARRLTAPPTGSATAPAGPADTPVKPAKPS